MKPWEMNWQVEEQGSAPAPPQPKRGGKPWEMDWSAVTNSFMNDPATIRMGGDIVAQTLGAMGGAAIGGAFGPAAPVTIPLFAGLGSVAGKHLMSTTRGEEPNLLTGESALDFATGAAGPVAGSTARGIARSLTGLSARGSRTAAGRARIAKRQARTQGSGPLQAEEAAGRSMEASGKEAIARAGKEGIKRAELGIPQQIATGAGAAFGGGTLFDPIMGALGGLVSSQTLGLFARKVLASPKWGPAFAAWAMGVGKTLHPERTALLSLPAIVAEARLTGQAKQAADRLLKEMREKQRKESETPPRDASGKFAKRTTPGVDHSGLERLFGAQMR